MRNSQPVDMCVKGSRVSTMFRRRAPDLGCPRVQNDRRPELRKRLGQHASMGMHQIRHRDVREQRTHRFAFALFVHTAKCDGIQHNIAYGINTRRQVIVCPPFRRLSCKQMLAELLFHAAGDCLVVTHLKQQPKVRRHVQMRQTAAFRLVRPMMSVESLTICTRSGRIAPMTPGKGRAASTGN